MLGRLTFGVVAAVFATPSLGVGQVKSPVSPTGARVLAHDFALTDTAGRTVRLSDFRGQVLLLDFWATTCGGCVKEIPAFIEIAAAYRSRGLAVLGVSEDIIYQGLSGADQAWSHVRPFVRDRRVSYAVVVDDQEVYKRYNIMALPITYLLDREGRIASTYSGVVDRADLEQNIDMLLREACR